MAEKQARKIAGSLPFYIKDERFPIRDAGPAPQTERFFCNPTATESLCRSSRLHDYPRRRCPGLKRLKHLASLDTTEQEKFQGGTEDGKEMMTAVLLFSGNAIRTI